MTRVAAAAIVGEVPLAGPLTNFRRDLMRLIQCASVAVLMIAAPVAAATATQDAAAQPQPAGSDQAAAPAAKPVETSAAPAAQQAPASADNPKAAPAQSDDAQAAPADSADKDAKADDSSGSGSPHS